MTYAPITTDIFEANYSVICDWPDEGIKAYRFRRFVSLEDSTRHQYVYAARSVAIHGLTFADFAPKATPLTGE